MGSRTGGNPAEEYSGDGDLLDNDDRTLLRRHVAGEPAAFGELVRRHGDRLWAVALRTLGNPEDAADALQDALLSAFRRAGSYRGDAAVSTWLHRIVVNACLDLLRRSKARPVGQLLPGASDPALPRNPIEQEQTRIDVAAALATLPAEQRIALVLVDVEGFPVAEVAGMLGIPDGTVKSRCARGRARLALTLSQYRNQSGSGDVRSESRSESTAPARPRDPGKDVEQ